MDTLKAKAALVGAAAVLPLILAALWPDTAGSDAEKAALREGRAVIVFWDRHSGHEHAERLKLINEFNTGQREVYVRALPVGYNALMEKTLTSIAGGAPPDVMSLDGSVIAQFALEGLFLPLDELVAETPELGPEAYFPHIWPMVCFEGHVWAMPTTTDSYCLVWNKQAFAKAGLDPERPPRTIDELNEYAARLTVRGPNGSIEQMGFLPWLPWDNTYLWGALFGGKWYDEGSGRVVCGNDPAIIASLAWQKSYTINPDNPDNPAYAMDPGMVNAFSKGLGEYMSANNPFYTGKVAMMPEGEWQVAFIPKFAPGLDWGVAPIPQPEGTAPAAFSPTIVGDVIPVTSRHPEAAKKYLRWFYSPRPGGGTSPASDYNERIRNVPPRRDDALQPRFMDNPKFRVFIEQMLDRKIEILPVMPVQRYLTDQMERQRERVVMGLATPEEAARMVEDMANRELDRIRAAARRGNP